MLTFSVVHTVGPIDEEAAGPSYSVPRLVRELTARGHNAEIMTLGSSSQAQSDGVKVTRFATDPIFPPSLSRLGRSKIMKKALLECSAQIFHTHGLWMMPNVYPVLALEKMNRPFVMSPRGMLGVEALAFSSFRKRIFWNIWQASAISAVCCFHATADCEFDDIRGFGLRQPVAVIPNGIDLPVMSVLRGKQQASSKPYILSLGRIHPKKGLDRLIGAFALVSKVHPTWILRIVGPDEVGFSKILWQQVKQAGLLDKVTIEPPVFGQEKFCLMHQAEVFCLATLHENFGLTVAESLAVETPVISTKGAPWQGLIAQRCGFWVNHGIEPLADALHSVMTMTPEQRRSMGVRGRHWMANEFSWESVGGKMESLYSWLLGVGPKPVFVRL